MSRPLFSVGEDVWLESQSDASYNGAATVVSLCNLRPQNHHAGEVRQGYMLTITHPKNEYGIGWCECALRKRPPPEEELKTFIDKLKIPDKIKETVDA